MYAKKDVSLFNNNFNIKICLIKEQMPLTFADTENHKHLSFFILIIYGWSQTSLIWTWSKDVRIPVNYEKNVILGKTCLFPRYPAAGLEVNNVKKT